jgi:molybdate transport system permease protein
VAFGSKEEIFSRPLSYSVARVTGCKNLSRVRAISPGLVEAIDWKCILRVSQNLQENPTCVGVRAHHIEFVTASTGIDKTAFHADSREVASSPTPLSGTPRRRLPVLFDERDPTATGTITSAAAGGEENIFPCWLSKRSETPFRMTLYLRLHRPPAHDGDYHLQAEVFKEKWDLLRECPFPWHVRLNPEKLFLMTG